MQVNPNLYHFGTKCSSNSPPIRSGIGPLEQFPLGTFSHQHKILHMALNILHVVSQFSLNRDHHIYRIFQSENK